MLDGNDTTLDWQRYSGDILVLPVGAFEQHGGHLPLDTDSITANYFARVVAEAFDAALLPPIHVGTSLEHTGFRGTFSLRPETLIQVIRDLAAEAERQAFRILVVVNGHGGNHVLVPVLRDINRHDGPLKIILANYWEFCATGSEKGTDLSDRDFHANEMETSLMLALRPELVGDERADIAPEHDGPHPLRQADLTTFGIGHFSPSGEIGYPSRASAEKGRVVIDSVRQNLLPWVRDRIDRLRNQGRYAGGGGMALRPMAAADVAGGMRLKTLAGWNQTEDDWRFFLSAASSGCFVATAEGQVVGTVTTLTYPTQMAWLGMMLVDPDFRRLGIGRRLMEQALESLGPGVTVKLDATMVGKTLYDQLDFVDEQRIARMTIGALPKLDRSFADVVALNETSFEAAAALDRRMFGADRAIVLAALRQRAPACAMQLVRDGHLAGFCLGRPGSALFQIGPVIAESTDDALALIQSAMHGLAGEPVVLDVPEDRHDLLSFLAGLGFRRQRDFIRMVRGAACAATQETQFATAGPELG